MHRLLIWSLAGALAASPSEVVAQALRKWTLKQNLELGTGQSTPDLAFSRIRDLVPLSDGSVLVVEARQRQIKRFDGNGNLRTSLGRDGGGPGEFRSIGSIGQIGDTVWVLDVSQRRISLFALSGRYLSTETWREVGRSLTPSGLLSDGTTWGEWSQPVTGLLSDESTKAILRQGRLQNSIDTVAMVAATHATFAVRDGSTIQLGRQPYQDHSIVVAHPKLALVYVIDRAAPHTKQGARFRVSAIRASGDTSWSRVYPYQASAIAKRSLDSTFNRVYAEFKRSGVSKDAVRRALFLPEFAPPVTAAFVSDSGALWLQRETGAPGRSYWVLGPTGDVIGAVEVPRNVILHAARGDAVWGVAIDDDDVPTVRRWSISR